MKEVKDLIANLKSFEQDIFVNIQDIIKKNEDFVLALNSEDQLYEHSIRSDGSHIEPEYTPRTVRIKQARGQITNRVTLRDTGNFYKSFFIHYINDGFEIKASDSKDLALRNKYNDSILGLTSENIDYISKTIISPALHTKLKKS